MLIADAVICVTHLLYCDLPVLMRQWNELASDVFLRRGALIGIDVRVVAAKNRMIRTVQSLKSQDVRAGPVKCEEHVDARSEMFLEFRDGRSSVVVIPIRNNVSLIDPSECIDDFGMNSSIVIAG